MFEATPLGLVCATGLALLAGCKSDARPVRDQGSAIAEDATVGKSMAASPQMTTAVLHEPLTEIEPKELVPCDLPSKNPNKVIDLAGGYYRAGDFLRAFACAELATDLVPQAVEAHHLRAAALTALARYEEAQVAFAMALALDPEDPETLADVADFYINILPPKRRATIQVGLEYARRGSERAVARRRSDRGLQGRLLLLEAEALNDLSQPDLALPRVEEALELRPELVGGEHELAVSLFNLLRFAEAEQAFLDELSRDPNDPYAHHHLGLIFERTGREGDGEAHFERARELSPEEFFQPVILSPEEFHAEVMKAAAELPAALGELFGSVQLELADVPTTEDLGSVYPPFPPTILGLFRGLPAGVEALPNTEIPARTIVLYRKNLGRSVRSRDELDRQIRKTLRHELGHLQGYDEDELRRRGME